MGSSSSKSWLLSGCPLSPGDTIISACIALGVCNPVPFPDDGTSVPSPCFPQVCMDERGGKEGTEPRSPPLPIYLSCRFFMKSSIVSWSKSTKSGFPYSGPSSSSILPAGSTPSQGARAFCTEAKGKTERGGPALPNSCSAAVK